MTITCHKTFGRKTGGCVARLAAIVLTALALANPAAAGGKAVILSINDVYRIEGVDGGRSGGMARVRALRAELEKTAPDLVFLHAGDFLGPSFMGSTFEGAEMIDVMNLMSGAPAADSFDERMLVTFGNHEFDATNCGRTGPLAKLVAASEFTWLASNLDFSRCDKLKVLAGSPRIAADRIIDSGGLKLGLFSLTLPYPNYADIVLDPFATACRKIEELRRRGADVVVALTHLRWPADIELLGLGPDWNELPAEKRRCAHAPDLIIGGHDHKSLALPSAAPRLFKADADAESAWVIEIEKPDAGLRIAGRLVRLDGRRKRDPFVHRAVADWIRRHDERFCLKECVSLPGEAVAACLKAVDDGICLKESFVRLASPMLTEEIVNRSYETGFGDWLADQVRDAGEAEVAFINSGAIRINQTLAEGTVLTRRHLEQMFPYKSRLVTREVTGAALWRAMQHAVRQRGEGPWAHFSGMAVALAAAGNPDPVARIRVKRRDGRFVDIGPDSRETFKTASFAFVLANGDGHGFEFCAGEPSLPKCSDRIEAEPAWPVQGQAAEVSGLVRSRLRRIDPARGLELPVDRRLCDHGDSDCLIARW